MPARITPLVVNEIYHVVNRGTGSIPIFKNKYDYQRFTEAFLYYQHAIPPFRYSKFLDFPKIERNRILEELRNKKDFLVEIIAYCLMPNHFHFILKQLKEKGIVNFLRVLSDSYSRYFNLKNKRKGGIFEGRFRAIRVENDLQLLHLSRYIHLNPYSSYLVKDLNALISYPFSSLSEYFGISKEEFCSKEIVLGQFSSKEEYRKFVFDRADYQRSLEKIKHQILE